MTTRLERARNRVVRIAIDIVEHDDYASDLSQYVLEGAVLALKEAAQVQRAARKRAPKLHKDKVYRSPAQRRRQRACKHDIVTRGPFVLCPRCGKRRPTKAG